MKVPMKKVSKRTGKNPVAQAVARQRLEKAITDQKIALYMLEQGERCADLLSGLAGTMTVVLEACYLEGIVNTETSVLKGGLNACLQVMMADSFDKNQTLAISFGLDRALELAGKVSPDSINKAWKGMSNVVG
jgi:hypothetical protein